MQNQKSNPVEPRASTYPDGERMFLGLTGRHLEEYSLKLDETIHDYGQVLDYGVSSMAKTVDNKIIFVCSIVGEFKEFDTSSHNEVNNFKVERAHYCIVTYDSQFLITAYRNTLSKWSMQTKQKIHSWYVDYGVCS
jgi:hypothetical protein